MYTIATIHACFTLIHKAPNKLGAKVTIGRLQKGLGTKHMRIKRNGSWFMLFDSKLCKCPSITSITHANSGTIINGIGMRGA